MIGQLGIPLYCDSLLRLAKGGTLAEKMQVQTVNYTHSGKSIIHFNSQIITCISEYVCRGLNYSVLSRRSQVVLCIGKASLSTEHSSYTWSKADVLKVQSKLNINNHNHCKTKKKEEGRKNFGFDPPILTEPIFSSPYQVLLWSPVSCL